MPAAKSTPATTRRKPGPKPKTLADTLPADPLDRRGVSPEFMQAVKNGLHLVGSKRDPVMLAKALYTQATIEIPGRRAGDPKSTIENPHLDGKNVAAVEATIALMHGVKL